MTLRARLRAPLQIVGFIVGVALLGWCVSHALSPENRDRLASLADTRPGALALLLALGAASLALNGLTFWATLRPARPLRIGDVQAANAVATFLNYLPFKPSVLFRVLVHNRRDGVPLAQIGSWFIAMAMVVSVAITPIVLATIIRPSPDGAWWAITAISLAAYAAVVVWLASRIDRAGTLPPWMARPLAPIGRVGMVRRIGASRALRDAKSIFRMIGSPWFPASVGLRLADVLVSAARFMVAASITGWALTLEEAIILAAAFFAIGVLSPAGMLGFREFGATGLASMLALASSDQASLTALLVGAADAIVNLAGAALGLAWLRPWRLARSPVAPAAPNPQPPQDPPPAS